MAGKQVAIRRGGRDLEKPYGPSALLTPDNSGCVIMQDAQIIFRNFAGREGTFNREGDRNFCVVLDPEIAEAMIEDEWNIKQLKSREEDVPGDYYVQVSLKYWSRDGRKLKPPVTVLRSSRGRQILGEKECELLDWVGIANADLIIRPNHYDVNGKKGIKAYLKTLFVDVEEDYLELKYADDQRASEPLQIESSTEEVPQAVWGQSMNDDDLPDHIKKDIVDAEVVEDK